MRASYSSMYCGLLLIGAVSLHGCDSDECAPAEKLEFETANASVRPDAHLLEDVRDNIERRAFEINRRWHGYLIYSPIQDALGSDISRLHMAFNYCASENCQQALASENQPYLIQVVHELCRTSLFGPLPRPGSMHLYFYVDESRHAEAREAILPCRQHVVIIDRPSKRTLEILEPDD